MFSLKKNCVIILNVILALAIYGCGVEDYLVNFVVRIETISDNSIDRGCGFVCGEDEQDIYIMTNAHVVANSDTGNIKFNNVTSVPFQVIERNDFYDAALISVDRLKGTDYIDQITKKLKFSTLDNIKEGTNIFTYLYSEDSLISRFEGKCLGFTYIEGIPYELLEIDIPINPGDSGSPVFNDRGEIIGFIFGKWAKMGYDEKYYCLPITKNLLKMIDNIHKD